MDEELDDTKLLTMGDDKSKNDKEGLRQSYERRMKQASFVLQESYQDSMLALKEFMDMLEKTGKSKILDFENAYMAENALSSVNKAEIDVWDKWVFDKIIKEIKKLEYEGAVFEDISDYVMLKHGVERNREMAVAVAQRYII